MAIEEQQKAVIVYSPNQSEYEILLHSKPSMRCLCTTISIEYGRFLNVSPVFHQICLSDFRNWNFYQWLYPDGDVIELDFRRSAIAYFALLEHLCAQMGVTLREAYAHFSQKSYINDVLLTPELFDLEAHALINTLIEGTVDQFALIIETTQRLTMASQFITQYQTGDSSVVTPDLQVFLIQNDFHRDRLFSNESCFCGRNLTCQRPAAFYDPDTHALIDTVDGLVTSCLPFASLLASTFACFYNETCVNRTFAWFDHPNDIYGMEKRIYQPKLDPNAKSRFNQTSTVKEILSNIFIEEWNDQYSYGAFFNQCNVSYCSYPINQRNNVLIIATKLIGLFGGLNVALQLLLPFLISLLDYFRNRVSSGNDRENQDIEDDRISAFEHIKMKISTMNSFAEKNNDHLVDMEKINQQRMFTRVYISLLLVILSSFIIYYAFIVKLTVTVTMNKPSIEEFERSKYSQSDTLRCPSSRIAIDYQLFAQIVHTTHQICSSEFISTDFTDFLYDFTRNPMNLSVKDFRMQAVYMFHVLRELCSLSQSSLNATIDQFMRTQLIAAEVLSRQRFEGEIQKKFDALLDSISAGFRLNLNLFRTFVQGNQLQTTSTSNWKFHIIDQNDESNVQTLPITYNQESCSCATSHRCFEPAKLFLGKNETFDIVGMQVGCTPLEALLASTFLEFFNQTFVNDLVDILIDQNHDMQKTFLPLKALNSSLPSRFKETDTVEKLINESFIELWNISANYSNYYHANQPYQCVYTYVTSNDALFITSTVLGLYGGLTVTLHFIVPYLVMLVIRLKAFFCERRIVSNAVTPLALSL